jgi:hypothetical protein
MKMNTAESRVLVQFVAEFRIFSRRIVMTVDGQMVFTDESTQAMTM